MTLSLLYHVVVDVEVIDFFEFRNDDQMRAAWKPALIAFVASMNGMRHLKKGILVDSYCEYVDNLLNTLLAKVIEGENEDGGGYDSCPESDAKYLRHGSEYLELKKDIQVPLKNVKKSVPFLLTSGKTNRPCCREVTDIIATFNKEHAQMHDVSLVIPTFISVFRLNMSFVLFHSAYSPKFQQSNQFAKPAISGARVTIQILLNRNTKTTKT